jgi:uncharacterized membrane protein
MRNRWFAPLVIAAMSMFGFAIYNQLPATVPIHWNISGDVDGTAPRLVGVLLPPIVALLIWALLFVAPRIDPRRESYARFEPTFVRFTNALVLFFALLHVATLLYAAGWNIGIVQVVQVGIGALFVVLGNELGRVQPNWTIGIRTPWTLANDEVWRRTHRLGGRAFVLVGLAMIGFSLLLPQAAAGVLSAFVLSVALVAIVGYSFLLWRMRDCCVRAQPAAPQPSRCTGPTNES